MTLDDILDMAGDWLTEAGIRLIVDTNNAHRYTVWHRLEAEFGPDIALIHAPADKGRLGPEFNVHWNWEHPEHAHAVVDAFTNAGCVAAWDGERESAVQVQAVTR